MNVRIIVYAAIVILITGMVVGLLATRSQQGASSIYQACDDSNGPDLSLLLNKSGAYSLSYVNAHGRRIAAIDESGRRYFYIYGAAEKLDKVIDQANQTIWRSNCT